MQFEIVKDILLSDTQVPDIFICDIMPRIPSDAVKVYLCCVFLAKHNKEARPEDLAAKLCLSLDSINAAFVTLEKEGLICHTKEKITVTNIKEIELNKLYNRKTTSDAEDAVNNTESNIKRIQCIDSINKMFFQGVMAPSWYTAIDNWFAAYHFDEDVMVSLIKYCYDKNALNIKYIEKVGATWAEKGITNHWELEKYMENCEKVREVGKSIASALRLGRNLSSYEEKYIETWLFKFQYDMTIIEEALKRTVGRTNPSFKYIHSLLEDWNNEGIRTLSQLNAYLETASSKKSKKGTASGKVARRDNFSQRKYDDDFYDLLNQSSIVGKDKA